VTGLFETIPDMKNAPMIVKDLLEIEIVRDYVVKLRGKEREREREREGRRGRERERGEKEGGGRGRWR
jgi:hypothetical protein